MKCLPTFLRSDPPASRQPGLGSGLLALFLLLAPALSASAQTSALRVLDLTAVGGQEATVIVQLVAQGNENALGFSLSFDPALLSYRGETLGAAGLGAALLVNTNQAASGKVGFAVARATGQQFSTGSGELLRLRFQLGATVANATLAFTDLPVARETVDVNAAPLTTAYSNGVVSITPLIGPAIVTSPTNQTVYAGTRVNFRVEASGSTPMQFQWRFNGTNIPGSGGVVLQASDCVVSQQGLLSWWPGEGTMSDTVGGHDGSPYGAVSFEPAMVGQGFRLAGSSIRAAGPFSISGPNAITLQAWFKLDASSGYSGLISAEGCCAYRFMVSPSLRIFYNPGTHTDIELGMTPLARGQFYHAALVISGGGTAKVFLNGQLISESSYGVPSVLPDVGAFLIGAGEGQGSYLMASGIIDEPSVWNRALSSSEIAAIYDAGALGMCHASQPPRVASVFTIPNAATNQTGLYQAVASNAGGSVTSAPALLTVLPALVPPSITLQPQSQVVAVGETVAFTASASGTPPLRYQWRLNDNPGYLPGQTNATLVLSNVAASQAGNYSVVVVNDAGSATSAEAYLNVSVNGRFIRVVNSSVATGGEIVVPLECYGLGDENSIGFSLAFDPTRLTFEAAQLGAGLSGVSLLLNTNSAGAGRVGVALAQLAGNHFPAGLFQLLRVRVRAGDFAEPVTFGFGDTPIFREVADVFGDSRPADFHDGLVTVLSTGPAVLTPPQDQRVPIYGTAAFSVTASGSVPLYYQWQFNGVNLPGATANALVLSGVRPSQEGSYSVIVTNAAGAATSSVATLTVPRVVRALSATGATGNDIDVPLQLLTHGDENAVGFSLNFDPARLTFREVRNNTWPTDAFLNVNTNAAAAGSVGFALAMPISQTFTAGTQQVALARFTLAAAPGVSDLAFGDVPIFRDLVNGEADSLLVDYLGSSVTSVLARPLLITPPASTNVPMGGDVWLAATASGSLPMSWQWQMNGTNLPNATNATLFLGHVNTSAAGAYAVVVANVAGSASSASAIVTVSLAPADLAVSALAAPAQVTAGQLVTVVWGVTNIGTSTAVGPWQDTVYLADNSDGSGRHAVGTMTFSGSLAANEGVLRTNTTIVPSDLSGMKYFVAVADSGNWLFEPDEANNTIVAATPTEVLNADLVVSAVQAPLTAQLGATMNVTWTVLNAGTAAASASWSDRLYLSTASNDLSGARLLRSDPSVAALAPGASYTNSQPVTLPLAGAVPGSYFVIAVADYGNAQPESSEGNNLLSVPITLTLPPLPDLAVAWVRAPATALPGQPVDIVWAVTNQGAAPAVGPWYETIFMTNISSGTDTLGMFAFTNTLPPGGFLLRTQSVTLPIYGAVGAVWPGVIVDSGNDVVEQDESNNTGIAAASMAVSAQLTLALPVAIIAENAPDPVIRALLTRNGSRAQPLAVSLASSDASGVTVPPSVTIPANQPSVVVLLTVHQDGVVTPDKVVTITASAQGFDNGAATVTVLNTDIPSLALDISASTVVEGQAVIATVTRGYVTADALQVQITTSSATLISTPTSVTIPPGVASTNFIVLTPDDNLITAPRTYYITATAVGFRGATNGFVSLDNDMPSVDLTFTKTNFSEGDGPQATMATLHRSPITAQSVVFALESTNTGAALVPAQVTIPPGMDVVSFAVAAVNNDIVDGPKQTLIRCFVLDSLTGARLAEAANGLLTVQDDDGPTLKVLLAKKVVPQGVNPATTATVTRNTETNDSLLVTLTSSLTNAAVVPDTVLIPAGATSAVFSVASINDGVSHGNQNVTLTASATNFTSGSDVLTVSDVNLPDLVVSTITVPAGGVTETSTSVSFRIDNQGVAPAGTNFTTRVFLSGDPVAGNDVLLGQYRFQGSILPGLFYEQSVSVRLPQASGDYWIVVQTDVNNEILELLKDNNTLVSATPIHVHAAYEASVAAGLVTAPAGTRVPMSGFALVPGTSTPPPISSLVNIHIHTRGTHRIISALTDANGYFSTLWVPLPSEAGYYEIGAAHPGDSDAPAQSSFTLFGFTASPVETSLTLTERSSTTRTVTLQNNSPLQLTGVSASILSKPDNLDVTLSVGDTLPGDGSLTLTCFVNARDASTPQGTIHLRLTVNEGLTADLWLYVTVENLRPRLVASPAQLQNGMKRGGQTFVQFTVANLGGSNSGPLTVSPPNISWLSVASTNPLPALAPGETNTVTLQLRPDESLPLDNYSGLLLVSDGAAAWVNVPFNFRALSTNKGDLLITAQDEYTYYAAGSPNVSNATVLVSDAVTGVVITNGVTAADGTFFVGQITEGYYDIRVDAVQHTGYRDTKLLVAGMTNNIPAFLSRQTVQYRWTVVPTQVEDRTRITIETTFETVVPMPVVTLDPALIDLSTIVGDQAQIDLHIANHGLIAAENFRLLFDSHPDWQLTPLISEVGELAANSVMTIPLTIQRLTGAKSAKSQGIAKSGGSGPCTISGGGFWDLVCGEKKTYHAPVTVVNASSNCGGTPGTPGGGTPGGGGSCCGGGGTGVPTAPFYTPPSYSPPTVCDCSLIPKICLAGSLPFKLDGIAKQMTDMLLSKLPNFRVVKTDVALNLSGKICTCCKDNHPSYEGNITGSASIKITLAAGPGISGSMNFDAGTGWKDVSASFDANLGVTVTISGSVSASYEKVCADGTRYCLSGQVGLVAFAGAQVKASVSATEASTGITFSGEIDGQIGMEGSLSASVKGCSDGTLDFTLCGQIISRCHLTGTVTGDDNHGNKRESTIGPNADTVLASAGICKPDSKAMVGGAQAYPKDDSDTNVVQSLSADQFLTPEVEVMSALQGSSPQPKSGICAKVRLQLDQNAVLTRDAFKATLEVDNNSGTTLQNLEVDILFKDASGQMVTNLFALRPPTVSVMTGVDGTGQLADGATGTAEWIILPTVDAAPTAALQYSVGGTLRYTQDGVAVALPLADATITVYPLPQLALDYFHQRDVYADDPFTDPIEPSIPFSLAVMARNTGYGLARSFHITSAQPKIVDNERGLLIEFKIIATEVSGQNLTPSLTADFGDIGPGEIKIGRWLMTSTLQGLFTDYKATFENLDTFGNKRLALVTNVAIHEMIHLVQAPGSFEDGKPDFLVNDVPDPRDLPDTLYLSDGTTSPVAVAEQATPDAPPTPSHLKVQLTTAMSAGWVYLRVPDPANGQYRLTRVQRSDGPDIPFGTNAWVTDRTFVGLGQRPVLENILHLLDYNSPGSYTLTYEPLPAADTTPPSSAVAALPSSSYADFPVSWSGSDNAGGSGIAFFDVYVAVDGGAFLPWLQRVTLSSEQYPGVYGKHYAFYSVATDNSGNREPAHTVPDAQTTVNLANTPPSLTVGPDMIVNEGDTVVIDNVASDSDTPAQTLTFALGPGAPVGASLDPVSGRITWITTEADGPSTNRFVVRVTDNGIPTLSATGVVTVIVREVNSAPVLSPIANYTINEGFRLSVTNQAQDFDIPPNILRFTLGPGAPDGATLDPISGIFRWQPTRAQNPSTNLISVIVTDNGVPPLSATQQFTVIVREVNQTPVLPSLPAQTVYELTLLTVINTASEASPRSTLSYALLNPLPGMKIDAAGVFTWLPQQTNSPSTNLVTTVATSSNAFDVVNPVLMATNTFTVIVRERNTAPVLPAVTDQTISELTLLTVTNTVLMGQTVFLDTSANGAGARFYRVMALGASSGAGPSLRVTLFQGYPLLSWLGASGLWYQVQYKDALDAGPWTDLGDPMPAHVNPQAALTYMLVAPPDGANIDGNGVITWQPSEAQGPGVYVLTTVVTSFDPSDPANRVLSATNSFSVKVNEVNTAPVLPSIARLTVDELTLLTVTNTATDSDLPVNTLTYMLAQAPTNALISPQGVITWIPSQTQSPSTNLFTAVVTDYNPDAVNSQHLSATNSFTVVVREVNMAPVLPVIADQTVNELTLLRVTNTAGEANIHASVSYSLLQAPSNMVISASGVITWTPVQAQSPSTNTIITVATSTDLYDLINPQLRVTNSFKVVVREVNVAPVLPVIADQTVIELAFLTVNNTASEANIHGRVSYSLLQAPSGMAISASGVITWVPAQTQGPSTNTILTVATSTDIYDLINPQLRATNSFKVVVRELNVVPVLPVVADQTVNELTLLTVTNTAFMSETAFLDASESGAGARFYRVRAIGASAGVGPRLRVTLFRDQPLLSWLGAAGVWYQVQYKNALDAGPWTDLGDPMPAHVNPQAALTYMLVAPPDGANIDGNGVITWQPSEAQGPGVYVLTTVVTSSDPSDPANPVLSATNSFSVKVNEVNTAPVPPSIASLTVDELTLLTVTNTATDSDLPVNTLTYTLTQAPANALINLQGVITWIPNQNQSPSTNLFTAVVTDYNPDAVNSQHLSATNSFTVIVREVNLAPVLPVIADQAVNELTLLTVTNTASEANIHASVSYSLLQAPSNMIISASGVITWTPTQTQSPGTNTILTVATSTDLYDLVNPQLSATNSFKVVVREVNVAPVLGVMTNQTVNELTLLTVTNMASEANIHSILSYALFQAPSNAVISSNGVITWTPSEAQGPGVYAIITIVSNFNPFAAINSLSATNTFSVTVNEVNVAPVLPASLPTQIAVEGNPLTVNNAATDADLPVNPLTYLLLSAPSGVSIDGNGLVTWTPLRSQAPGTYTISVKVTDTNAAAVNEKQLSATNSFVVQVLPTNHPPVINTIADRVVDEMVPLVITPAASDPDAGDVLTFSFGAAAPSGAVLDARTGRFTWTPTEEQGPGHYPITITVTDNGSAHSCPNLSASVTFTIDVREVNRPPVLAFIPDYALHAGGTLSFVASASDPDLPKNTLAFSMQVFSLVPPDPTNAALNPATGAFSWTTTAADEGNVVYFAVAVTDNGVPPLSSTRVFSVDVLALLKVSVSVTNEQPRLTWNSASGNSYQLEWKSSLGDTTWRNLGAPVPANGSMTSFLDTPLRGTPGRFYRIQQVLAP